MTVGFPNLFMITGPGSPSVLSNMAVSIEQHVEWISDCLDDLRRDGFDTIEPTPTAEAGWVQARQRVRRPHADAERQLLVHGRQRARQTAGVPAVRRWGRHLPDDLRRGRRARLPRLRPRRVRTVPAATTAIIRQLKPDVGMMLQMMASLGLPPIESLSPDDARAFMAARRSDEPAGARGRRGRRRDADGRRRRPAVPLYRPASRGRIRSSPTSTAADGCSATSTPTIRSAATCASSPTRSSCRSTTATPPRTGSRPPPTTGSPRSSGSPPHAEELGGVPGRLAVCGWSAGGNVAAVAAQSARDAGGPALGGQVLLTPVTDSDLTRDSYVRNGDGFVLTASLMAWFWDHYADEADRDRPEGGAAAGRRPVRPAAGADRHVRVRPARRRGCRLRRRRWPTAGVETRHIVCGGLAHTSVPAVGVLVSGDFARDEMAAALREMLGVESPPDVRRSAGVDGARRVTACLGDDLAHRI